MWIADGWKDYEVIDTSCGEKLERWGDYLLVRPDPQVIWDTPKVNKGWKHMNGHYHRSKKGGGEWEFFDLPQQWDIHYKGLTFNLKPFSFKHTGLFPEQAVNWDWFGNKIRNAGRPVKVLNLFAYTGGATLAAAAAGASVTHVDASKGMVTWAKENAVASGLGDAPIRWLVDDCVKFVEREIRRGNHYDAIILDPPRAGTTKDFIECATALNPRKILYISCDPRTQVRDLNQFRKQGYVTNKLELVDLFPYTDHIESVCVLEKKQFNAKPTKKAQRQAQFRSSKMSKKKR